MIRRALICAVAVALLAGCDVASSSVLASRPADMRGLVLDPPLEKPDFISPTATGTMFDFRRETDGKLALVFFGFTYCPDICPVHMTNISAALDRMSASDAQRVTVLFVTTDPARDTEERLSSWLGAIDPRIIGLRPSQAEAIRIQSALGIQPAMLLEAKPGHDGNYGVSHAAQVIAFAPDNLGRAAYAAGTRQTDWAHDIPRLLKMKGR